MKRRDFLRGAVGLGAGYAVSRLGGLAAGAGPGSSNPARLPRRPYGDTGVKLSIIGFGGIVVMNAEQDHADRVVAEAVEKGVNYFDVAPTYGDAEVKLGPALEPYRKNVFLACKTAERTRDKADAELKASLKRLRTDHLDLYQLHAIQDVEKDVDVAFGKGGAMETFVEARKAGVVRHLGFSAHTPAAALAAMERFDFDSVLFPINFACWHAGEFGPEVVRVAESRGVARLALKAMARRPWPDKEHPLRKRFGKCWYMPVHERDEAERALRFTLSRPITAAIPPGEEELFRLAVDLAMDFRPLTDAEATQVAEWGESVKPIFERKEPHGDATA